MSSAQELLDEADQFFQVGRFDRAIDRYTTSHKAFQELGDEYMANVCLNSLGLSMVYENHIKEGIEALMRAREAWIRQRRVTEQGKAERDLGTAYMLDGSYFKAEYWLVKSRDILGFSNHTDERGLTEAKLGRVYSLDGEFDLVDACFDEAFNLIAQAGSNDAICLANIDNAFACMERMQWGHMHNHLELAWQIAEQAKDRLVRQRLLLIALRVRWQINQRDWHLARKIYTTKFSNELDRLTPNAAEVLNREVGASEISSVLLLA